MAEETCPVCNIVHPVDSITEGHIENGIVHNEVGVRLVLDEGTDLE